MHHIALAANDPEMLAQFYESVLGLSRSKVQDEGDRVRSVWLALGGDALLMIERADHDSEAGAFMTKTVGWHLIALRVEAEQRETWRERLLSAGVEVRHETDFTLYFSDPEGNRVALSHYPEPAHAAGAEDR